jgi:aspartyl/asparaginyl beta-hydroxylase (cupin superfamily)
MPKRVEALVAERGGPVYEPLAAYPVVEAIRGRWHGIRDEVLSVLAAAPLRAIPDERVQPGSWSILPLLPEAEDLSIFPDWEESRRFVPELWALLQSLPAIQGYTVSCLRAGGYIAPHRHENPFVTAILTLQAGPACYMIADGERNDFHPGEIAIFDYRREHLARNFGSIDWISLLMLLPPAPRTPNAVPG